MSLGSTVQATTTRGLPSILVVEGDDRSDATMIAVARGVHAHVIVVPAVASALEVLARTPVDVILLAGSGTLDDVDICRTVRRLSPALLIVVADRATENLKVAVLNAAADDYIARPFSLRELEARVAAHVRRARLPAVDPLTVIYAGDISIDFVRRRVSRGATPIALSRTEWAILEALARNRGIPMSHEDIFRAVWNKPFTGHQNYVSVYVTMLRRKIERVRSDPEIIITSPGFGYQLADSP
jgi:two-component system KDP operon response regulator KdpE